MTNNLDAFNVLRLSGTPSVADAMARAPLFSDDEIRMVEFHLQLRVRHCHTPAVAEENRRENASILSRMRSALVSQSSAVSSDTTQEGR